jgi:hypothetical protein
MMTAIAGSALFASSYGGDYIVRRQGSPDPLQLELTDRLDPYGILDLHQHSRANEDLTRLGFVAEPSSNV